jgi:hypothetical protein
MNAANFIFWLFHIPNLPTLVVLTPLCLPYTPFANRAHLSVEFFNALADYDNTFVNCTNFFAHYANKFDDYANTPDDWVNTSIDSINTLDKSSSDLCNPKSLTFAFITHKLVNNL